MRNERTKAHDGFGRGRKWERERERGKEKKRKAIAKQTNCAFCRTGGSR